MGNLQVAVVSLGCDKNTIDSEIMLGILVQHGFAITTDPQEADVIVVNTCCFIEDAQQESIDCILESAQYKTMGKCRSLVVAGCLAQRFSEELSSEIPEVDGFLGTGQVSQVVELINRTLEGKRVSYVGKPALVEGPRIVSTPTHYAYLKIAEGCDHRCGFCVIPSVRGRFTSRPVERVLDEAKGLVAAGAKELILVAQDTSRYGMDLEGRPLLASLLHSLHEIEGLRWIRVLYTYPAQINDELLTALRLPKVCRYLDLPLQHASPRVLRSMGRPVMDYRRLIASIREKVPGISLRTTFIVGYPTEEEEDFQQLLDFVQEAKIENLGVFQFSPQEGTKAARLPQLPTQVVQERYAKIMEVQQGIVDMLNEELIGTVLPVMVDGPSMESNLVYQGRHEGQAPDIDGLVYLGVESLPGTVVNVRITDAHAYDLVGEVLDFA
ncbi:MAG: 30S ribosomal protein S12 methylthiotransferase RimO [Limnochordia bacterium]|nr:30S ribosomal protein S12 methylthiotransferase RimO [Limnochordia bacterium]MDD4519146.1 30S ribosomal protein S12 methylthiotransferase RimO [Limnochordia bacterium]